MSHIVFNTKTEALRFQAWIDTRLGYPKAGTLVGGGTFAPGQPTLHHRELRQHPDGLRWAHHAPAGVVALLGEIRAAHPTWNIQDPVTLDGTWAPLSPSGQPSTIAAAATIRGNMEHM